MAQARLQKVVARAGIASRRAAEQLITEGRVRVNGRVVTELGTCVDPGTDRVEVDGRRLVAEKPVYLVLHKPRGVVTTVRDPEGRPTVLELVPSAARIFPVGRLDFHTSGVLLLTNDGEFCDALVHPRRDVPKTYVVKVAGEMPEAERKRWEEGVPLEDGRTRPAKVRLLRYEGSKTWLEVTLFEGRNQQIRRMGEHTGYPVMRLARISFAGITADGLRPSQFRALTREELLELREEYGVPKRVPKGDMLETIEAHAPRAPRTSKGAASTAGARGEARAPKVGARGEARAPKVGARGEARAPKVGAREARAGAREARAPKAGAWSGKTGSPARGEHRAPEGSARSSNVRPQVPERGGSLTGGRRARRRNVGG